MSDYLLGVIASLLVAILLRVGRTEITLQQMKRNLDSCSKQERKRNRTSNRGEHFNDINR